MHWDGLSSVFAVTIVLLCAIVGVFSISIGSGVGATARAPWSKRSVYFVLLVAFCASMLVTVASTTFIGVWAGISATTLATTFLVGYSGGKAALEAAWKYLMLCSFGIAIALVGMLLLGRAAMAAHISPDEALSWHVLIEHAHALPMPLTRVALTLMLIGFATKAGLVPMHAWLPDAHSKAPAPVSALLSGLLVSCALYAIMRTQAVAMHTASAQLFDALLLYGGSGSIIVAALLMLAQHDVKRLLSYSTVEHAGVVAVALGLATPLGTFAALYHILSHAFTKSLAFLSIGVVQHERGTTSMAHLRGRWEAGGGRAFLAALTGLAGLPPCGLFFSELLIVLAAAAAHQWIALAISLAGLLVGFAALARLAVATESGRSAQPESPAPAPARVAVALTGLAAFALALLPFVPFGRTLYELAATLVGRS